MSTARSNDEAKRDSNGMTHAYAYSDSEAATRCVE